LKIRGRKWESVELGERGGVFVFLV